MQKSLEEWLSYVRSKGFKIVGFVRYDIEAYFTDDAGTLKDPIGIIEFHDIGVEVLTLLNDGGVRAKRFSDIVLELQSTQENSG